LATLFYVANWHLIVAHQVVLRAVPAGLTAPPDLVAGDRGAVPPDLVLVLVLGPLRWVGLISCSLYLWHWPVIVFMSPARTGIPGGWLDVARIAGRSAREVLVVVAAGA